MRENENRKDGSLKRPKTSDNIPNATKKKKETFRPSLRFTHTANRLRMKPP